MKTNYVLITAAKNEVKYIGPCIDSIVAQIIRPKLWLVVDDGSIDGTTEIINAACESHRFIRTVRLSSSQERTFGAKVKVLQRACEVIEGEDLDFLGNLDADITLPPDYYQRMLEEMAGAKDLGIVSGVVYEPIRGRYQRTVSGLNHAVGAVQFFRRECFNAIGGYCNVTVAGEDSLMERKARMLGWSTRSLPGVPVYHHKPTDSASGHLLRRHFRAGMTEYHIATHPLVVIGKAIRRVGAPPICLGTAARLLGYFCLLFTGSRRDAPEELRKFVYKEQMQVIKQMIFRNRPKMASGLLGMTRESRSRHIVHTK